MRCNIKFHPIERLKYNSPESKKQDDPYHTSIKILDGVCRTLRDIHYNIAENQNGYKSSEINPFEMMQRVKQYNTGPHSAFYGLGSKLGEYNKANDIQPNNPFEAQPLQNKMLTNISPALVQSDSQLQYYLIRKLRQKNMRKMMQPWFNL
jgi:hypothetical protein